MTSDIRKFRRTLLGIALCSGLGVATLPTAAQAGYCMKSKPHAYKGSMMPYGAKHYPPMMQRHHHYHDHKGMHGYKSYGYHGKDSMHPGSGKAKSYGDDYATYPATAGDDKDSTASAGSGTSDMDIIETAASAENFSTLIRAARAADLTDVLRGDGPFTVFAPSDAAFANLPEGTLDALIADKDKLVAVLTYHVVPERLTAADLLQRREFTTVQGQKLTIDKLNVATADIDASNGIIHVIDAVLIPEQ
jgi:uncharacterized surface protein with fasciclin (FAS1) repeats